MGQIDLHASTYVKKSYVSIYGSTVKLFHLYMILAFDSFVFSFSSRYFPRKISKLRKQPRAITGFVLASNSKIAADTTVRKYIEGKVFPTRDIFNVATDVIKLRIHDVFHGFMARGMIRGDGGGETLDGVRRSEGVSLHNSPDRSRKRRVSVTLGKLGSSPHYGGPPPRRPSRIPLFRH